MSDGLSNAFGNIAHAVIVEKDGKLAYFNESAARMISNIEAATPEDVLPAELLAQKAANYIGEAKIAGKTVVVYMTTLDDYRVIRIIDAAQEDQGDWTNIFDAVSYELNNSLSVLKMSSGLLLPYIENQGDSKLSRYASMIYHCYYNIQRITNNLSDFSDFIHSNTTLNRSSYDLVASCRALIDSASHLVSDRWVELSFKSVPDSLIVYADKVRLDKLILNLLSNSLMNAPAGRTVVLSVVSAGNRFILTVSDNGDGIPADIMQTAWCRYRIKRELTDRPNGVGLGMAIIHAIAQQHGGSVVLESSPESGTTVTVSIPMAEPEANTFKERIADYDNYQMQQLLTELSGVISSEKYTQKYMD